MTGVNFELIWMSASVLLYLRSAGRPVTAQAGNKARMIIRRRNRKWLIGLDKVESNVAGKYYVDSNCIDCDVCRETAPENFRGQRG